MLFFQLRHGFVIDRIRQPVASRAPVMVHQQIPRHAGQPSGERPVRSFVTRQRFVNPQKNFLAQIVGVGRVARKPVAQIEHPPRVPPYEFLPGGPIAPETFLHQLGIGLQSLSASVLASPFGLAICNAFPGQNVPRDVVPISAEALVPRRATSLVTRAAPPPCAPVHSATPKVTSKPPPGSSRIARILLRFSA